MADDYIQEMFLSGKYDTEFHEKMFKEYYAKNNYAKAIMHFTHLTSIGHYAYTAENMNIGDKLFNKTNNDPIYMEFLLRTSKEGFKDSIFTSSRVHIYHGNLARGREIIIDFQSANKDDIIANISLAYLYLVGNSREEHQKLLNLVRPAIIHGIPAGYTYLSQMYSLGKGVEKNELKAFKLAQKAADTGYNDGYTLLGTYYLNGTGVEINYNAAFDCFLKAIELGSCNALSQIGLMYERGLGRNVDKTLALYYYKMGEEMNDREARRLYCNLKDLDKLEYMDHD